MDTVYIKIKDLSLEEFETHKKNIELGDDEAIPEYNENMIFAYGIDAEEYIIGGDEVNCWPVILDLENEEVHDLVFDENNPPTITQDQIDNLEVYAYEDEKEDEMKWYHSAGLEDEEGEANSDYQEPNNQMQQ